jgi:glucosamine-6-phosphate deaminase
MLIHSFFVDKLKVDVYDSRQTMGEAAGKYAVEVIKDLLSKKDEIYIIFAAAPSQNEFLQYVSEAPGIDWGRIHALHMDEYIGLPEDAPQGFGNFLRRAIFDKVPFASVDYIYADESIEDTCARYTAILEKHPVDIVFMGIGENGHIAFNDPGFADFDDPLAIKKVALDEKCRNQQVHDGCFASLDRVPKYALTLTVPTLFKADKLICVVPAPTKADAVRATVCGPVTEACPATIMRLHNDARMFVDSDSGKYILNR